MAGISDALVLLSGASSSGLHKTPGVGFDMAHSWRLEEFLASRSEDAHFIRLVALLTELSSEVAKQIPSAMDPARSENVYGEEQLKIDVWANEHFVRGLENSGLVAEIASEELKEPTKSERGGYFSVTMDPIDGSSNVASDNVVGSIFGIYASREPLPAKGRNLLSSLYFLYGPYTQLVLALKDGVFVFVPSLAAEGSRAGGFVTDGKSRRLPSAPSVYGIGGLARAWTPTMREFVSRLEERGLKLRYGGSLVGDFNQVLTKGGFFAYPELIDAPNGKYRLQFESNPLAFITEKAGGKASDGKRTILDVEPSRLDERIPTYLGNAALVNEFEELQRAESKPETRGRGSSDAGGASSVEGR